MLTSINMEANNIHNELVDKLQKNRRSWIEIAEDLYNLKIGEKFKLAVGEGIDTWNAYVNQPEIGLSKGEADKLVRVYKILHVDRGIDKEILENMPLKTLLRLSQAFYSVDNDKHDELVGAALNLSYKDFNEYLHDIKEENSRTYSYVIMKKCNETGSMSKVHNISDEEIVSKFNL